MVARRLAWEPGFMQSIAPSPLAQALDSRVFYVETSVPAGLTLNEYRRGRPRRSTRWGRLKRLAGAGTAPAAA
jgi:hypothetical protein